MTKNILSVAILLASLLGVSVIHAQNPKISNPDKPDVRISDSYANGDYTICVDYARITGAGNASSVSGFLKAVGTFDVLCFNNGQNKQTSPKSIPGQSFSTTGKTVDLGAPDENGVIVISEEDHICVTIQGSCKTAGGAGWTSEVSNAHLTNLYLYVNGKQIDLTSFLSTSQFIHK